MDEDFRRWKTSHAHGSAEWKWLYYWKQSICSLQSPPKRQWITSEIKIINPEFHMEAQKISNSWSNHEQRQQHWRYHNTWHQAMLQRYINKTSMILAQKQTWRPVEQNTRPKHQAMQLQPCIYHKGAQNICRRKGNLFNKCYWENWLSIYRRLRLDPSLSPCTNINSKRIKDLNVRSEAVKLLKEIGKHWNI
jgi:hypothetical protein